MNNDLTKEYQEYLLSCISVDTSAHKSQYFTNSLISEFSDGMAKITNIQNKQSGYIEKHGLVAFFKNCKSCGDFHDGLAKFMDFNNLYGYIDKTGNTVIDATYTLAFDFHEGISKVYDGFKYGYIDKTGKVIIPCNYKAGANCSEGLIRVVDEKGTSFFDKTGNIVLANLIFDQIGDFHNGLARVKNQKGCYFIKKDGNVVNQVCFLDATDFSEGYAFIRDINGYYVIDTNMNKLYKVPSLSKFSNGVAVTSGVFGFGYINNQGKELFTMKALHAHDFKCGVATIERQQFAWSFVDTLGRFVTPYAYNYLSDFKENYAIVKKQNTSSYTYIDHMGHDVLFNFYYGNDNIGANLIVIRKNNKYGFINKDDKIVIPCKYDYVEDFKDGFAHVKLLKDDFYIDVNNKKIPASKINTLNVVHAIRAKKELFGYGYYTKKGTYKKIKYKPIYDYQNHILCYNNDKLMLYVENQKKYITIGSIYNKNIKITLGLNYFLFNDKVYIIYNNKYDVIDYNLFKFNTNDIVKLKITDGITNIMTYKEYFDMKNKA